METQMTLMDAGIKTVSADLYYCQQKKLSAEADSYLETTYIFKSQIYLKRTSPFYIRIHVGS